MGKTILKNLVDRVVMTVIGKLPRRFKNRVRLIVAAIFAKNSVLEETMASIQKLPDVVLRRWGNPYDVLTGLLPQYGPLDRNILELVDKERHIESSEIDVVRFLLVSKGGFLILHDTVFHPGPRRVALEMFENGFKGCSITTSQGSGITIFQC